MSADQPVILVVHSDAWVRDELAERIREWSDRDFVVLAASSEKDAWNAISGKLGEVEEWLSIIICDDNLSDGAGEDFLLILHSHYPRIAKALITASPGRQRSSQA
ncbi:hypothetical protein ABZ153_37705 [Streptomyces sp. NPDC006290]|uniref:hypothetical protein n=1 Tax=Streptomyces sp. NPDC006290 TaxID=3156745 RepID=UPI0033A1D2CC